MATKTPRLACLLAAAMLLPALVHGEMVVTQPGVKLVPPAANVGAVVSSEQASTSREVAPQGGQTLRCWQHGRLLYENAGFKGNLDRQANKVTIARADGEQVVVFDQKDAFCMLSNK